MIKILMLVFSVVFFTSSAYAAAVNPIGGMGAKARGMGGAGMATADGAAAFFYNPALLTETGNFAEVGTDYYNISMGYKDPAGREHASDRGHYFVPIMGVKYGVPGSRLALGVGFNTPYTFCSDFNEEMSLLSKLSLSNISPAVAYKLTDTCSIGASANIGQGKVKLVQPVFAGPINLGSLESKADGWGASWQVGAIWKPYSWWTWSASYRSKTRVELDGKADLRSAILGNASDDFSSVLYFPGRASIGTAVKVKKLTMAVDGAWYDYSSTDKVDINYQGWADARMMLDWQDSWSVNAGFEYEAASNFFLRTGAGWQSQVIPDKTMSPATPDMDGWVVTGGLGYKIKSWELNAAYAYAWGENEVANRYAGAGKYDAEIHIVSVAAAYRW